MLRTLLTFIAISIFSIASTAPGQDAKPLVHPLFSDHMVLQRDKPVAVWGWAEAGSKVTVRFGDSRASATADATGKWMTKIGPLAVSAEPQTLSVEGLQKEEFQDVLVGDVWICSGQSNMEWAVAISNNPQAEIAAADHPNIRLFTVPKRISMAPQELVDGSWSVCSPKTVGGFSAVGYYFGRALSSELKIPIGLVHTSWGGTVAEAWTSAEALDTMDDFREPLVELKKNAAAISSGEYDFKRLVDQWWEKNDVGSKWAEASLRHSDWKTMEVPTNWEQANVGLDDFDGVVWFRKEFDLPAKWAGKDVVLSLGAIDDADTTWVNGHMVGAMGLWNQAREYTVKADHLQPGRNVIAVRVFDGNGGGGIYDKSRAIEVRQAIDETKAISLKGAWHFKAGSPLRELTPFPQPFNNNPNKVTVLYNGMLACLKPFGIKGAIWYQGESNAGRPEQYRTLLPTMIADWRKRFDQGDFPFLIVQLANFMQQQTTPVQSGWAELREAQAMTAQRDEKAGLAVITDIGEANDIHPRNKQDVGKRLALQALTIAYGHNDVVDSGPTIKDMGILGDSLRVEFANVGSGLVAKGDKLTGFAIAEATGDFVWADAEIKGDAVILWNEDLAEPIRVRYNWANNPIGNLFNKEGLPAAPFRTDRPR